MKDFKLFCMSVRLVVVMSVFLLFGGIFGCFESEDKKDRIEDVAACTFYWDAQIDGWGRPRDRGYECFDHASSHNWCLEICAIDPQKWDCEFHPDYRCK